jgi:F0F1-type ATP synthase membrane subunit b/b'
MDEPTETEASKWFDEYIVPMLVQFGATLAAFALGVVVFFKVLNKTKKAFEEATELVNTSNNNNADIRAEMKQLKKDNEAWKKGVEKKLVAGVDDTNKTVHKILEVQELAHTSNPALVGNGTAKKISEVVRK